MPSDIYTLASITLHHWRYCWFDCLEKRPFPSQMDSLRSTRRHDCLDRSTLRTQRKLRYLEKLSLYDNHIAGASLATLTRRHIYLRNNCVRFSGRDIFLLRFVKLDAGCNWINTLMTLKKQNNGNQSRENVARIEPDADEGKVLCLHCQRTATNGIKCRGFCVADSDY